MDTQEVTTIEIQGVKYEVDLRGARKIHEFRVGDRVKVLVKDYSDYKTHAGVIIGIDAFKALPTVVVAYLPSSAWDTAKIEFAYLNAQSKDVEIAPMTEDEIIPTRDTVITMFDRAIGLKRTEIAELETKREYFLRRFGTTFGAAAAEMQAATSP